MLATPLINGANRDFAMLGVGRLINVAAASSVSDASVSVLMNRAKASGNIGAITSAIDETGTNSTIADGEALDNATIDRPVIDRLLT
jgi:hypothetical protein